MRVFAILILLALAAGPGWSERVEPVWEQRFDVPQLNAVEWETIGAATLENGALHTASQAGGPPITGVRRLTAEPMPDAGADHWLRLEWALVPVKTGAMGQAAAIDEGPMIVIFGEGKASLNLAHAAKIRPEEGKQYTFSCDFTRDSVRSWKIDGVEQLEAPVPAWKPKATAAHVLLGDLPQGASETRYLWARLSRVYPDDPQALRLSAAWEEVGAAKSGERALFVVGQASPMDKVFREAADFRGSFDPHVRIAAAGRERESFQLVLLPIAGSLRGVSVGVSDLLRADGAARLPAGRVEWHPVGYVQTVPSNSAVRRTGWWWPDVLLPAGPFEVEAGFVQPVWFTVDVPADQPPGVYRGFIALRTASGEAQTIGLELTVRPFSLPVRGKLKTAFCLCAGMWEMWYQPDAVKRRLGMADKDSHGPLYTSYECEDVLTREQWRRVYDFLLAHRLSPTTIYSDLKNGKARVVPAREDMEYCYERGMNATCLVCVDVLPSDRAKADQYLRDLEAWLAGWDTFIREKNWPDFTWYVHGFDESDMRAEHEKTADPSIQRIYGMIGEKFPRIKRESANPLNPAHAGLFDIWTPLTAQWQPELRARQQAGDEVWAYVCCSPGRPYANFFIDYPGVDPRILPWQYYQHGVTGFLYYLINHYEKQENWNMAAPKWPERPWNPLSFETNSDGILIYPGPDAAPLASTRLENLRDGIEDYEALAMLAALVPQLEARHGPADLIAHAKEVLQVRPDVTQSWTEYTQQPQAIAQARAEVDGLIARVQEALRR